MVFEFKEKIHKFTVFVYAYSRASRKTRDIWRIIIVQFLFSICFAEKRVLILSRGLNDLFQNMLNL